MSTRTWSVLSWNVRGINSDKKWDAVRDRVINSNCDIVCLQETKKQSFNLMFIKKICPAVFDAFEFIPSVGAYGGSIIIWKSCLFLGNNIFENRYCLSVQFLSSHNNDSWVLSNIYAPCTAPGKREFLQWFKNIQMPHTMN